MRSRARFRKMRSGTLALLALGLVVAHSAELPREHGRQIGQFLEQHCVMCHGPEKQKGDLRLDTLAAPPKERERWTEVLEAIANGDMPPKKEPRPPGAAAEGFMATVA